MPSAGYSHFYLEGEEFSHTFIFGVNALGGLFSFLPLEERINELKDSMCQCPRRAILISTYVC